MQEENREINNEFCKVREIYSWKSFPPEIDKNIPFVGNIIEENIKVTCRDL